MGNEGYVSVQGPQNEIKGEGQKHISERIDRLTEYLESFISNGGEAVLRNLNTKVKDTLVQGIVGAWRVLAVNNIRERLVLQMETYILGMRKYIGLEKSQDINHSLTNYQLTRYLKSCYWMGRC